MKEQICRIGLSVLLQIIVVAQGMLLGNNIICVAAIKVHCLTFEIFKAYNCQKQWNSITTRNGYGNNASIASQQHNQDNQQR